MSKAQELRQKLEAARQIQQSSLVKYRELFNEYTKKQSEEAYFNLTETGKIAFRRKLKEEYERKAVELAKEVKTAYLNALAEIKREAEDVLLADPAPADERATKLFAMKAKQLQSAVLFAPNASEAMKAMRQLVEIAKEHPSFARKVQDMVYPLAQHVADIAGAQKGEVLRQFAAVNRELFDHAMTSDQRAAREILSAVERQMTSDAIPYAVKEAVRDRLSGRVVGFLENPDAYLGNDASDTNDTQTAKIAETKKPAQTAEMEQVAETAEIAQTAEIAESAEGGE